MTSPSSFSFRPFSSMRRLRFHRRETHIIHCGTNISILGVLWYEVLGLQMGCLRVQRSRLLIKTKPKSFAS
ncbi:hypothetical protein D5086_011621 [Populus alba]|uniref:Uncharacterized protein n=1 Tax=Populus alba TaxID=43335 RepID=A0ACC4CE13_POPAL